MFARTKKSGKHEYLQVVENRREGPKVKQHVIATLGRLDQMTAKGEVENLVRSLARFSEQAILILSGRSDISAHSTKIGPALILERLWKDLGIQKVIQGLLAERFFTFDVERALFLTVFHRLMAPGSDRFCDKWCRDYSVKGTGEIELHHLYRAMAFLGEEIEDQENASPFPDAQRMSLRNGSLRLIAISIPGWTWSFLIPPPSISRERGEKPLATGASAKITVPT